jgi:lysophospholipase L1-like esterase
VVSFGVNDTTEVDGAVRVPPERSVANLRGIADGVVADGVALLVVGPPPVADPDQNERIAALDELFAESAGGAFPYVSVFGALQVEPDWMRAVAIGDGAHPGAEGYRLLAELVMPAWEEWIG